MAAILSASSVNSSFCLAVVAAFFVEVLAEALLFLEALFFEVTIVVLLWLNERERKRFQSRHRHGKSGCVE